MSMNFTEFKQLMGADPMNQDPETLRARNSSPEFEQCAAEAAAFELKLSKALDVVEPGDEFIDEILSLNKRKSVPLNWFAIAASVLVMIGVAGVAWKQYQAPGSIEEYVSGHYAKDGQQLIAMASEDFDAAIVQKRRHFWVC